MIENLKHRNLLAAFLPSGKAWVAKNIPGKLMYKLLEALSCEYVRADRQRLLLKKELNPASAEVLLSRHEQMWGLPNKFMAIATDIAARRFNLKIRILLDGVSTKSEIERNAEFLGLKLKIVPMYGKSYPPYQIAHPIVSTTYAPYIIQVKMFDSSREKIESLKYFINAILPAHIHAIYTK